MKVTCVDNYAQTSRLTRGTKYLVIESAMRNSYAQQDKGAAILYYRLKDDEGCVEWFWARRFSSDGLQCECNRCSNDGTMHK